jgi:hypothetical protein
VSLGEILEGALGIEPARWTRADQTRVTAYSSLATGVATRRRLELGGTRCVSGDIIGRQTLPRQQGLLKCVAAFFDHSFRAIISTGAILPAEML